ncbi:MAG: acyltransferase family protein [Alphaproteobacteria bacterium]|nr:acyltransferase family protein [Alphaproteobacteria bacterium]
MFEFLKRPGPVLPDDRRAKLRAATSVNSAGFDPWGLHLDSAEQAVGALRWLYEDYFRVRVHGIENVPEGRVMLVPNHSGQLPLDGMLVGLAMVLEADPPRVVRGMVERWVPSLPFVSSFFTRLGQVTGDPENCRQLLEREQCIMVFPEGVRGSGKTWWHRYQLQEFGTGFVRLALEGQAPIVPVAVIGAEETYPAVYNARRLAKLFGAPYVPVTPMWPLLGPLGAQPLPVRIDLHFGEPIRFVGDPDEPDEQTFARVAQVKDAIRGLIEAGLEQRPELRRLDRVARLRGRR